MSAWIILLFSPIIVAIGVLIYAFWWLEHGIFWSWGRKPTPEAQMVLALFNSCAERDWKVTNGYRPDWVHPCGVSVTSGDEPTVTVNNSELILKYFERRMIGNARKRLKAEWEAEALRANLLNASRNIEQQYGHSADIFDITTGRKAS